LGDAKIGTESNIGAGHDYLQITTALHKYPTSIGNKVFIAAIRAGGPVAVGRREHRRRFDDHGNVPADGLGIARAARSTNPAGPRKSAVTLAATEKPKKKTAKETEATQSKPRSASSVSLPGAQR